MNNKLALINQYGYLYEFFYFQEMYKKYKREQEIEDYLQKLIDLQLKKEIV